MGGEYRVGRQQVRSVSRGDQQSAKVYSASAARPTSIEDGASDEPRGGISQLTVLVHPWSPPALPLPSSSRPG